QRFECHCGRQFSIRYTTVFAGSRAPLLAWFTVVISLIVAPELPTGELAKKISIVRRATMREMAARVRDALAAADRDKLLAGLPELVACHLRQVYQRVAQLGAFPAIIQSDAVPFESKEFTEDLA